MRWLWTVLVVAGCSQPAAPPLAAGGPAPAVLPVVVVAPGAADTLAAGLDVRPRDSARGPVRVSAAADGRAVVTAGPEAQGLHVVPLAADGGRSVLLVRVARPSRGGLRLLPLGVDPDDPSLVRFEARSVAADGSASLPEEVDDEEGVVALDGDRLLDDNAVFFDPPAGEIAVDLDALGPGRRLLRLVIRDGARVSAVVGVPVLDRRALGAGEAGR